ARADRRRVASRSVAHLHPDALAAFGDMTTSLASELADGALVFARSRRYTLVDRPRVDLVGDPSVVRTDILVAARFADPIAGADRRDPVMAGVGAAHADTGAGGAHRPT